MKGKEYITGVITKHDLDRQLASQLNIQLNKACKINSTISRIIRYNILHRKAITIEHLGKITIHRRPPQKNPLYRIPARRNKKHITKIIPPRCIVKLKVYRSFKKLMKKV